MTGDFNVKKLAIWHAIAPIYGSTTVIITAHVAMDCPDKIPLSGMLAHCGTTMPP